MDPWNQEFLYRYPRSNNSSTFEVRSLGPDGKADTDDDLVHQDPPQTAQDNQ